MHSACCARPAQWRRGQTRPALSSMSRQGRCEGGMQRDAAPAAVHPTAVWCVPLHQVVGRGRRPFWVPAGTGQASGPNAHILLVSLKLD